MRLTVVHFTDVGPKYTEDIKFETQKLILDLTELNPRMYINKRWSTPSNSLSGRVS